MKFLLRGDLTLQSHRCKQAQRLLGIGLLVAAGALYLCEIRPANQQLAQVHKRYLAACLDLQRDQTQAGQLPAVEEDIKRLRARVERFDKKLPRHCDLPPFINDISLISKESSLKKLIWRPDTAPRKSDLFSEQPIKFTFEGDFQTGVIEFLRRTEDMKRLTRVQKLDLRKIGDPADGQVRAELTMNIYYAEE